MAEGYTSREAGMKLHMSANSVRALASPCPPISQGVSRVLTADRRLPMKEAKKILIPLLSLALFLGLFRTGLLLGIYSQLLHGANHS
jgi:hypothetical protein